MSDPTPTREQTVEANLAATIKKYGDEAWPQITATLLTDISVSLAMLVDNDTTTASSSDS